MKIQERGIDAFDAAVFTQVEFQVAFHGGFELLQLEPAQFPIKIVLYGSLADALGERANCCADFHAQQRFPHDRRVPLAKQCDSSVL